MAKPNRFICRLPRSAAVAALLGVALWATVANASDKYIGEYSYVFYERAEAEKKAPTIVTSDLKKVCPRNSSPKILSQELEGCKRNQSGTLWACRKKAEYVCNQ